MDQRLVKSVLVRFIVTVSCVDKGQSLCAEPPLYLHFRQGSKPVSGTPSVMHAGLTAGEKFIDIDTMSCVDKGQSLCAEPPLYLQFRQGSKPVCVTPSVMVDESVVCELFSLVRLIVKNTMNLCRQGW